MDRPLEGSSNAESSRYWDGVLGATLDARPIEPWRVYMQHVYVGLIRCGIGLLAAGVRVWPLTSW